MARAAPARRTGAALPAAEANAAKLVGASVVRRSMRRQKTQHTQAAPKLARDVLQGPGSKKYRNVSGRDAHTKARRQRPTTVATSTSIRARFCSLFCGSNPADLDSAKKISCGGSSSAFGL